MKLERTPEKLRRNVLGCNVNEYTVFSSRMKVKVTNGTWLEMAHVLLLCLHNGIVKNKRTLAFLSKGFS